MCVCVCVCVYKLIINISEWWDVQYLKIFKIIKLEN